MIKRCTGWTTKLSKDGDRYKKTAYRVVKFEIDFVVGGTSLVRPLLLPAAPVLVVGLSAVWLL